MIPEQSRHLSGMLSDLNFGKPAPPKIEIHLEQNASNVQRTYTTGDRIQGFVSVVANCDTPLGRFGVLFHGKSQIRADKLLMYERRKYEQVFLKIVHPITDAPDILKKDQEYRFPFSFTVPDSLPAQACYHHKQNIHVFEAHTRLPPTLGAADKQDRSPMPDDFASDIAQISYSIRVLMFPPQAMGSSPNPLAEASLPVRVIPKVEEQPPREAFGSSLYRTHKEKVLKHGLLIRTAGRLRIDVSQPGPIKYRHADLAAEQSIGATATVELSYEPVKIEEPPELCSITTGLGAITLYSATPWETFPDLPMGDVSFAYVGRGNYWKSITLSNMSIASVPWTRKTSPSMPAQDEGHRSFRTSQKVPSETYMASVMVPIAVPHKYRLVPTFHSCLISRVYLIDITLSYYRGGTRRFTSDISLRIPIQVMN